MTVVEGADRVETFLQLALKGEPRAAVRFGMELIDAGVSESNVIANVLAPSQREIGNRWQKDTLSIADEHLASGVTESTLFAFSSIPAESTERCSVLVTCSEGDWHSIAAHMIAEQLRAEGFAVTDLGASTPADEVSRFLERRRLDALVVSCNLPIFFTGIPRLVDAAHRHNVPVLVGGRALGGDSNRASTLGADAYGSSIEDAVTVLRGWRDWPPDISTESVECREGALLLEASALELAESAYADLLTQFPMMAQYSARQLDRTREDLTYIIRFLAAAELVDDDLVFLEFLDWLEVVLSARNVPRAALVAGLESSLPSLNDCDVWAHRLVNIGLDHLTDHEGSGT